MKGGIGFQQLEASLPKLNAFRGSIQSARSTLYPTLAEASCLILGGCTPLSSHLLALVLALSSAHAQLCSKLSRACLLRVTAACRNQQSCRIYKRQHLRKLSCLSCADNDPAMGTAWLCLCGCEAVAQTHDRRNLPSPCRRSCFCLLILFGVPM